MTQMIQMMKVKKRSRESVGLVHATTWRLGWSEASRKFGSDNNGEDEERASEEDEDVDEEVEEHRSNLDGATFGPGA